MSEDYWFDEAAADAAVRFFADYLCHTEGEWAGKPFVLTASQENDIIRPLFGWKRADGTRRYRRCAVWEPRKNGKTELAAGVALLALVADGEVGGSGFAIAKDRDQAGLVFAKASTMVGMSPALSEVLEVFKTSVYCPELNASFRALSGNPEGKHGLSASFIIGDEMHEWPDARLYTYVHQSTAARRQPLEFLISTAGLKRGFGWEFWDHCLKVRDGVIDDPELLVIIYAADQDDDWKDPKTWAKANPNLGVTVKYDYLEAECRRAEASPRLENDFRRYHLNQWTEQDVRWIPMDKWGACTAEPADTDLWRRLPAVLAGRPCFGGIDLSATTDFTAVVWVFPPVDGDEKWAFVPRFWLPKARLDWRALRDRAPYADWAANGALMTTPGDVVDYRAIKEQIYADAETFKVSQIAIDRWNATQVAIEMADEGLPIVKFGQGYASMSAPSKEFERMVLGGLIEHGNHPVMRWMAANAAVATDPAGNIKPAKDKSTDRIDGVVAAVMGIGLSMGDETPAPSYIETGELMVL